MIEGLTVLPKVQAERSRQMEKDVPAYLANAYMSCDACELSDGERALWRCGWLPEAQRVDHEMRPYPETTVCAGYSSSMPEVIEASRLLLWARRGQLEAVADLPLPAAASLCIDILDGACNESEREGYRRQRREMEAKRGPT